MDDSLPLMTLIVGLVFLTGGLLFKAFPPKKINSIYGYRTASSMRNPDTWTAANNYSARLMLFEGIILTIIGLLTLLFPDTGTIGAGILAGIVLLSAIILIVATEVHLKKLFDKHGNPKTKQTG